MIHRLIHLGVGRRGKWPDRLAQERTDFESAALVEVVAEAERMGVKVGVSQNAKYTVDMVESCGMSSSEGRVVDFADFLAGAQTVAMGYEAAGTASH